jgi:hypothetical protein
VTRGSSGGVRSHREDPASGTPRSRSCGSPVAYRGTSSAAGSAHDDAELEALKTTARQLMTDNIRRSIDLEGMEGK